MRTKVKMNGKGVRQLLTSSGVRGDLTRRAEQVLQVARASAPVVTGAYAQGLHVVQATTDRAVVRVAGGTDHDRIVEANTGNLARALDAAR